MKAVNTVQELYALGPEQGDRQLAVILAHTQNGPGNSSVATVR